MESTHLKYFNNYQEIYKRPPHYFDSLVEKIVSVIEQKDQYDILDVGCGFGDFLESCQEKLHDMADCYGLTLAEHEIEYIKRHRPFIHILRGNQTNLQDHYPPPRQFDIIINFGTLSYVPQKEQLATTRQMLSLLKANGLLILCIIDSWVKYSSKIVQEGEGFVQFYFSPNLFPLLGSECRLTASYKDVYRYRILLWEKADNASTLAGGKLLYSYILKNHVFHLPMLKKTVGFLKRRVRK